MSFVIGQRVADYEVVGILGSGGMGCVYRVCNVISRRTEAMKVLSADFHSEPEVAARFRDEIRTLAGLDHPHIAQLRTALQDGKKLLMIMEFVEGCTLQQLAGKAPLPLEATVSYVQQVLAALSYAHSHGVVHRDIKPANIMVTPQGVVKLTDFGIAKSKLKSEHTRPGTTLGSINYMSPEQAAGSSDVDERSDIYSLGITLYELLTGRLPFDDESAYVVLHRQMHEAARPPIEINTLLPKPLNDLIMKALEKYPTQRFQTVAEFSEGLREITGITGSKAVLIAADFSKERCCSTAIPEPVPPTAALADSPRSSQKGPTWLIDAAAIAAMVVVASMAVVWPAGLLRDGSPTAKNSGMPISPVKDIVSGTDTKSDPGKVPAKATAVEKTMTTVASAARAALRLHPEKLQRTPAAYQPVTLAKGKPEAGESETSTESGMPGPGADMPKAETVVTPVLSPATVAELQQVRRQKDALDARVTAIKAQMTRLRSQKINEGHDLNQDMADAYVNMNVSFSAGSADLASGDANGARSHIGKAAYEVSVLEKLFSQNP